MTDLISEKKMLTLRELSERYSFSLLTLRRWGAERRYPLYKVSNRIRVSIEEWESWLEEFHIKPEGDQNEKQKKT